MNNRLVLLVLCIAGFQLHGMSKTVEKAKEQAPLTRYDYDMKNYFLCVSRGLKSEIKSLLDRFPDYVNKENERGNTALLEVVHEGFKPKRFEQFYEVFDCLIAKGADVCRFYKNIVTNEKDQIVDIILDLAETRSAGARINPDIKHQFSDQADRWITRVRQSLDKEQHEGFDVYVAIKKIEAKKKREFFARYAPKGFEILTDLWQNRQIMIKQALKEKNLSKGEFIAEFAQLQDTVDREIEENLEYFDKWSEEKSADLGKRISELENARKMQFIKGHSLSQWLKLNKLLGWRFQKASRLQNIFDVENGIRVYSETAHQLDAEYAQKSDDLIKDIELTKDELEEVANDRDTKHIHAATTPEQQMLEVRAHSQKSADLTKDVQDVRHEIAELKKDTHLHEEDIASLQINVLRSLIEQTRQRVQEAETAAEEARKELDRLKREDDSF